MGILLRSLTMSLVSLFALYSPTFGQADPNQESAIWFSKRGGIVEIQQRTDALYLELAQLRQLPSKEIKFKARANEHYLINALLIEKVIFSSYLSPELEKAICGLNTDWFDPKSVKDKATTICTWEGPCREDVKHANCKVRFPPTLGTVETVIRVPDLTFNERQTATTLHKSKGTSLRTFLVENAYGCRGAELDGCVNKVIQQNAWRQYHNKEMSTCSATSTSLDKCLDGYAGSLDIPSLSLSTTLEIFYPDGNKKPVQDTLFKQDVIFERKGNFDQAIVSVPQFAPPSLNLPWPSPERTYLPDGYSASLALMDQPVDLDHCGLSSVRSNLRSEAITDDRLSKLASALRNPEIREICICRKANNCSQDLQQKSNTHNDALEAHCDDLLYLTSQDHAFSQPTRRLLGHGTHLLGLMAGASLQDKARCSGLDGPTYRSAMTPFHKGHVIALDDVSFAKDMEKADAKKVLAKIRALGGEITRDVVNLSLSFEDAKLESIARSEVCATKTSLFVVQPGYLPANPAPGATGDVANGCSTIPGCLSDIPNVLSVVGVAPLQPNGYALPPSHLYGATEKCCSVAAPSELLLSFFPGDRYAWVSGQSQATAVVSAIAMLIAAQRNPDERKRRLIWPDDIKARLIYTSDPDPTLEGKVVGGYINPKRATEHILRHVVTLKPKTKVDVRKDGVGQPTSTVEVEKLASHIPEHSGQVLFLKDFNVYNAVNDPAPEYFAVRPQDAAAQPHASGVKDKPPIDHTYVHFKSIRRLLRREGGPYEVFVTKPSADFRALEAQVCGGDNTYIEVDSKREPALVGKAKWFLAQETKDRKVKGMVAGTNWQVEFKVSDIDDYVAPIVNDQKLGTVLKLYK